MDSRASVHPADETLVWYGLGKLDDTMAEGVNRHLANCPDCRRRIAEMSSKRPAGRPRNVQARPESRSGGEQRPRTPAATGEPASANPSRLVAKDLPPDLANHPQYEVLREIGRGAIGIVYLARNKLMDRLEVLKS